MCRLYVETTLQYVKLVPIYPTLPYLTLLDLFTPPFPFRQPNKATQTSDLPHVSSQFILSTPTSCQQLPISPSFIPLLGHLVLRYNFSASFLPASQYLHPIKLDCSTPSKDTTASRTRFASCKSFALPRFAYCFFEISPGQYDYG